MELDAVLVPDGMMPVQWLEMHRSGQGDPHLLLWLAVFECAVRDWQWCHSGDLSRRPSRREVIRRELEAWFESEDRTLGSFRFLCDLLGVDVERIKGQLLQWRPGTRKMTAHRSMLHTLHHEGRPQPARHWREAI